MASVATVNYKPNVETTGDVLDQTLWYNDHIRRARKMFYLIRPSENGINTIWDIYDVPNRTFLTFQQIVQKYSDIIQPLDYNTLVTAIPNLWKQCQGGHGTGKTGNLAVNFSRQGKHREFSKFNFLHGENCGNTGKILKI